MIPQAPLEGSPCPVVLDPVATERQDGAIVGVDRHLDVDLTVGLVEQDPHFLFDLEHRRDALDVRVDRIVERARHAMRLPTAVRTDYGRSAVRNRIAASIER